jgi:hypothetical protein
MRFIFLFIATLGGKGQGCQMYGPAGYGHFADLWVCDDQSLPDGQINSDLRKRLVKRKICENQKYFALLE